MFAYGQFIDSDHVEQAKFFLCSWHVQLKTLQTDTVGALHVCLAARPDNIEVRIVTFRGNWEIKLVCSVDRSYREILSVR